MSTKKTAKPRKSKATKEEKVTSLPIKARTLPVQVLRHAKAALRTEVA